ncbi:MAG: hypothetical protein ACRD0K_06415 [Egibacteraceae bacterium]
MSSINGGDGTGQPHDGDPVYLLMTACDRLAARDLSVMDQARLRADVESLTRAAAQVTAERLRCVAAVAGRAEDTATGAEQARRLLRTAARLSGGQAARQTQLAVALTDPELAATAAALTAGRISPDQADALAQTAPTHPQLVAAAQDELIAQAAECDDRAFRQALADRRHAADPRPRAAGVPPARRPPADRVGAVRRDDTDRGAVGFRRWRVGAHRDRRARRP